MSFCATELIDGDIKPNPWEPAAGDVYSRPTPMGWDRVVVLGFKPEHKRPSLHDISEDVLEPPRVHFIDPYTHQHVEPPTANFRAWLASYDMRPSGRMRLEKPQEQP
jgi:hypothetical protein